jgi:hypothetical protein
MKVLQQISINSCTNDTQSGLLRQVFFILPCLVLFLLVSFSHTAHSAIVKWKDDKDVTHYGDSKPPQYANRESSEISKQGITLKRFKPVSVQDQAIDAAKLEQDKKDKALLSAFTNANEIDLARDRNLQLDIIALDNLQLQKKSSLKKLTENQSLANAYIKKNKPVPDELSAEIKMTQEELENTEKQINTRQAAMQATRQRFDEDKKRFIMLKSEPAEKNIAPKLTQPTKP